MSTINTIKRDLILDINNINFTSIISTSSGYSVVWNGKYKNIPCAIKMSILNTGYHYDKDNNSFMNNKHSTNGLCGLYGSLSKVFESDAHKPFYHTMFKNKRAISKRKFELEVNNQEMIKDYAPAIYTYGIISKDHIDYCFIVMELMDISLRRLLFRRLLSNDEIKILNAMLDSFHEKYFHGDLKCNNIAYKDKKFYILDCLTIKRHEGDCSLIAKDNRKLLKDWERTLKQQSQNSHS